MLAIPGGAVLLGDEMIDEASRKMAEVVADRLHGGDGEVSGFDTSTRLKFAGVDVASFGDVYATTPGAIEVDYSDPVAGIY